MNVQDLAGLTLAFGDAGIVAGTTTTMTASAAINYCIDGKAYIQPTTTNVQPATTDANTGVALEGVPAGYGTVIVFGYGSNQSTTIKMAQGEIVKIAPNTASYTPGAFIELPEFPKIPDNFCPVGYVTVRVATDYTSGGKYIFGTSNTTATGAQNSAATAHANLFCSISAMPSRPQAS